MPRAVPGDFLDIQVGFLSDKRPLGGKRFAIFKTDLHRSRLACSSPRISWWLSSRSYPSPAWRSGRLMDQWARSDRTVQLRRRFSQTGHGRGVRLHEQVRALRVPFTPLKWNGTQSAHWPWDPSNPQALLELNTIYWRRPRVLLWKQWHTTSTRFLRKQHGQVQFPQSIRP